MADHAKSWPRNSLKIPEFACHALTCLKVLENPDLSAWTANPDLSAWTALLLPESSLFCLMHRNPKNQGT